MARKKRLPPIHPGFILREDPADAGISLNRLARDLRVPMNRISAIVNGKRSITADTALRLALFFGTSPQYWMNLQTNDDIAMPSKSWNKNQSRNAGSHPLAALPAENAEGEPRK